MSQTVSDFIVQRLQQRSQLATKAMGKKTWTKRDWTSGEFMSQKKAPAKAKYKGVRRER